MINFNHTSLQASLYHHKLLREFAKVLKSGRFLFGDQHARFTQQFAAYTSHNHVIPVGSGHDALVLALQGLQINTGDEVIIQANAYPTAFAVAQTPATLRLCDVDENGQMQIDDLLSRITPKTKAVIVVHMYGLCTDIVRLKKELKKRRITLIEDCAQSLGTQLNNQYLGSFGEISTYSFYPTKNLGTAGDGGAITTNATALAQYLTRAVQYGEPKRYHSHFVSGHSRMGELQAAVLNVYLRDFLKKTVARKKLYAKIKRAFAHNGLAKPVRLLQSHPNSTPVPHLLVIATNKRTVLQKYLTKVGIPTHIHYPQPIHMVKAFQYLGYKPGEFPMSEVLAKQILSLPFHEYITTKQLEYMVRQLNRFYA